jgi:hypothetical protein
VHSSCPDSSDALNRERQKLGDTDATVPPAGVNTA